MRAGPTEILYQLPRRPGAGTNLHTGRPGGYGIIPPLLAELLPLMAGFSGDMAAMFSTNLPRPEPWRPYVDPIDDKHSNGELVYCSC
jgi:hypothetical protein